MQHFETQKVVQLPLEMVVPSIDQPRKQFNDENIAQLAESIENVGIIQPILVEVGQDGKYKIIAGERRWRAARLKGLKSIPCIVKNVDQLAKIEIALIENIQRENLNPIDEAQAYQRLVEEHLYTQETLAKKIGKDRSTVANSLRLLQLPSEVIDDLRDNRISAGHARALCILSDRSLILRLRDLVIRKSLSVRQTEKYAKKLNSQMKSMSPDLKKDISLDMRFLCDQFKGHLGTKVKIVGDNDKGKLEISYFSQEDLERISDLILGRIGVKHH